MNWINFGRRHFRVIMTLVITIIIFVFIGLYVRVYQSIIKDKNELSFDSNGYDEYTFTIAEKSKRCDTTSGCYVETKAPGVGWIFHIDPLKKVFFRSLPSDRKITCQLYQEPGKSKIHIVSCEN